MLVPDKIDDNSVKLAMQHNRKITGKFPTSSKHTLVGNFPEFFQITCHDKSFVTATWIIYVPKMGEMFLVQFKVY